MRLLIVDDKEGYREQLRQLFTQEGYEVITATSGEEAIVTLEAFPPDIVITDVLMPHGDGFFMLEQVQERDPRCPVIVITAYGSQESAVTALRLGAYDYVTKPFDLDVILVAVERAAEHRRLQQAVIEGREKLAVQVSEMSALYDTSLDLVSSLSLPQVLESILSRAADLLHAKGGSICLCDKAQQQLTVAASHGQWDDLTGRTLSLGEDLAGKVAQSGRPLRVDDYSAWEGRSPSIENAGCVCLVGVPLLVRDRVVGVLDIEDDVQRGGFSEADEALLVRLAPLAALAIEHARLFEQEQNRHKIATMLTEVSRVINSTLQLEEVLDLVLEGLESVVEYDCGAVLLLEQGNLWVKAARGASSADMLDASIPTHENLVTQSVMDSRRPAVIADVQHHPGWYDAPYVRQVRGWIGAPLIARDEVIGLLMVGSAQASAYDEEDAQVVMALAQQAAAAITNACFYAEAERNWREQRYLQEIAHDFSSTLDPEQVLRRVMVKTNELLGVEASSVVLLSKDRQELVFHTSVGGRPDVVEGLRMRPSEGIVGWVISHGESLLVPDVTRDPRHYAQADAESGFETRSILSVPLIAKGTVIGAIEMLNKIDAPFTAGDRRMMEALALSAATAIENARLFQREKEALERLREAQDELVHAQRLAALGQIGVTVRHEVNNPLSVVLGNADWLLEELAEVDGELLKALEAIRTNALRIRDIVDKFKDIQTDRVTEYGNGIEMIDIHDGDAEMRQGEDTVD